MFTQFVSKRYCHCFHCLCVSKYDFIALFYMDFHCEEKLEALFSGCLIVCPYCHCLHYWEMMCLDLDNSISSPLKMLPSSS